MMGAAHNWLWSTFGGSSMLWDVALGVFAGVVLVCLGAIAVYLMVWSLAHALGESIEVLDDVSQWARRPKRQFLWTLFCVIGVGIAALFYLRTA